ncbi:hypothetical protein [Litorilituus lipolyticus]|uniref:Uncharacterized protein n=1 Tax=Litorilituus lipolyticus TaxID=2491017 RepID=A0A502KQT8_9GAMM|nr:hypothetical protein [Litorilituus lipolyticus]TPH13932.1 hypothetical protein EPA86_12510 [Litorilituus lipolyticus]
MPLLITIILFLFIHAFNLLTIAGVCVGFIISGAFVYFTGGWFVKCLTVALCSLFYISNNYSWEAMAIPMALSTLLIIVKRYYLALGFGLLAGYIGSR